MSSGKGLLLNTLGALMLRQSTVTAASFLGPNFRRIQLSGPSLSSLSWSPGDKIQVLLPGLDVRTYTPIRWNATNGSTDLLVFLHGDSPGARWGREVREGDSCRFLGPQRSLRVPENRHLVLFGDETSFAVANAISGVFSADSLSCVFEVGSAPESRETLAAVGVDGYLVQRSSEDVHLGEVADRVRSILAEHQNAALLMTGRAQGIRSLQERLRSPGQPALRAEATRAYWSLGKTGLD